MKKLLMPILAVVLAVSGCFAVGPDYRKQEPPVPARFSALEEGSGRSDPLLALMLSALLVGPFPVRLLAGEPAAASEAAENIALGKSYTLYPQPNYALCTDGGDTEQLTDGKTTADYCWTQRGTVGWQAVRYASVTIDLGSVQPVSGVSLTTAAGVAGVTWPLAVYVLNSDDGQAFYNAGDLVALDRRQNGPWPEAYAIRRLVTRELRTWGRYVQLMIVPLPGGPYTFTDEVEVFRGPPTLIDPQRGRALRLRGATAKKFSASRSNPLDVIRTTMENPYLPTVECLSI